jgi:predicted PurR-regulated permease PerM
VDQTSQNKSSAIIILAAVVIVIYGMQMMSVLLVPFLIAAFLALITVRPMLWLQEHRVPSILAALLIVTMLMLILATVGVILGSSIAEFTAALPSYQARLDVIIDGVFDFIVNNLKVDESIESISDMIDPGFAMGLVAGLLNSLRDVLTNTFLIIFTMIFILLEASTAKTKFQAAFGKSADSLHGARAFMQNLGRYLGIKTIVSMATGLCAGVLTWTLGATALGFVGINIVFGNFLEPRLMGYGVGISPLVVFVGLIAWGWIFGPVGMLLSVPLTMTLKMALESDARTRWVAILLGSERDAEYALRSRERENVADQATPTSS